MPILPALAAAIFALLGAMHLVYTLHDCFRAPRYFAPKDRALLEAMRRTRVALAPEGRDYWTASLGFHFSHSFGALLLALLIFIANTHAITGLRPLLVGVAAAYTLVAWRCWFHIPLAGCALAFALLVAGWFP